MVFEVYVVLVLISIGFFCCSCSHTQIQTPKKLLMLSPSTLGLAQTEGDQLQAALETELQQDKDLKVLVKPISMMAFPTTYADANACLESPTCLSHLGKHMSADLALSLIMAGLSDVRLIRARLVDANQGLLMSDIQQNVTMSEKGYAKYAEDLRNKLFLQTAVKPWYKHWWVWTGAVGLLASATATWLLLQKSPSKNSDAIHLGDL